MDGTLTKSGWLYKMRRQQHAVASFLHLNSLHCARSVGGIVNPLTQHRGLCEMARTHRRQATTMESTGKQHETEPSIYGNDQTTPNNLLSLRALRATTTPQQRSSFDQ